MTTSPAEPSQGRSACCPHATFVQCPQCDGELQPEHAHYRCGGCGWRDSCCD